MILSAAALLLQVVAAAPPVPQASIPVQLGLNVSSDTVTVGQRFIAVIRVRAPRGATIEFPTTSDSASLAKATATQLIGKPAFDSTAQDSTSVTKSAAYRLVAWDVGPQPLGLPDVVVRYNGQTGYVSVADRGVFVRSVLPEDSALRVPKPPRPAITVEPFDWRPILYALAAIAAALLAWRLWVWFKQRAGRPLEPFAHAEREFARIEAMHLIDKGEGERHVALMSDVLREYLAARVPEIERSHTSSELLAAGGRIHSRATGLGELLWRTDLVKFAGTGVGAEEARAHGGSARQIVRSVEEFLIAEEEREEGRRAA